MKLVAYLIAAAALTACGAESVDTVYVTTPETEQSLLTCIEQNTEGYQLTRFKEHNDGRLTIRLSPSGEEE